MNVGPLVRLTLFGILCPCHESDDEYLARISVHILRRKKVSWFRYTAKSVSFQHATLHLLDRPLGPTLQLTFKSSALVYSFQDCCSRRSCCKHEQIWDNKGHIESNHYMEECKQCIEIPLFRVDRVELSTDDHSSQQIYIHVLPRDKEDELSRPLLQLCCDDLEATFESLTRLLHWDRIRRADLDQGMNYSKVKQLLNQEKVSLIGDE